MPIGGGFDTHAPRVTHGDAAESYRSIPLFPDPHDEVPMTLEVETMLRGQIGQLLAEVSSLKANSRRQPSDWERLAVENADLLLAASEKYEFAAAALEVANEEIARLKGELALTPRGFPVTFLPSTGGDILSSAMRGDRPLDPYGRR